MANNVGAFFVGEMQKNNCNLGLESSQWVSSHDSQSWGRAISAADPAK